MRAVSTAVACSSVGRVETAIGSGAERSVCKRVELEQTAGRWPPASYHDVPPPPRLLRAREVRPVVPAARLAAAERRLGHEPTRLHQVLLLRRTHRQARRDL